MSLNVKNKQVGLITTDNLHREMAAYSNTQTPLSKIEDSIECSICTHRFREPKWLNCFHTFCLQCLQEICKNQRPQCQKLSCPLCREETTLTNGNVSDLPDNSDMKALVESFTQQEKVLKQKFEQLEVFSTLVAKARRSKTEFELSAESLDKSLKTLDQVFCDTKGKIRKKATKEVFRIREEEQKLIKEVENIHQNKVEFLKSLQASDRREATQTAHKLDEVNHLMTGGATNGNKGQDFRKRICKDLEKATQKRPQSVPDGLTFMDFKENDVISLGKLVQRDGDLTLLNQWTRQTFAKKTIVMKYTYKDDQWSPLNPEGKRVYDRDFLLQFQGNYYKKPEGLPHVPCIVLDKAIDRLPRLTASLVSQLQASDQVYPVMDRNPRQMWSSGRGPNSGYRQDLCRDASPQNLWIYDKPHYLQNRTVVDKEQSETMNQRGRAEVHPGQEEYWDLNNQQASHQWHNW